ncbi:hypothetical protein DPMN_150696 [Dreissena polymorpha]|uniref:Uncharacterized protein n=1 Tax=Dreissena polymorpha TaxID=45954 RepID=A0A9D4J2A5_DREPO|nr:hypothetical protein DPMN_150696 [Dreissena polymorpha]
MNEYNARMMDKYDYASSKFQDIIVTGYREAVSNKQAGIHLTLSHFLCGLNILAANKLSGIMN